MFCPKCGQNVPDGAAFCGNCGAVMSAPSAVSQPQPEPQYQQPEPQYQQPEPQYQQPQYQQPVYQQPQYQQPQYQQPVYQQPAAPGYQQPQPAGRSRDDYLLRYSSTVRARGIVALIFSTLIVIPLIIAWIAVTEGDIETLVVAGVLLIIAMIMLIPGFIVSLVGLSSALRFKKQYGTHNGNSLAGLIMSVIALVISVVMLIVIIGGIAGGAGFIAEIFRYAF